MLLSLVSWTSLHVCFMFFFRAWSEYGPNRFSTPWLSTWKGGSMWTRMATWRSASFHKPPRKWLPTSRVRTGKTNQFILSSRLFLVPCLIVIVSRCMHSLKSVHQILLSVCVCVPPVQTESSCANVVSAAPCQADHHQYETQFSRLRTFLLGECLWVSSGNFSMFFCKEIQLYTNQSNDAGFRWRDCKCLADVGVCVCPSLPQTQRCHGDRKWAVCSILSSSTYTWIWYAADSAPLPMASTAVSTASSCKTPSSGPPWSCSRECLLRR